MIDLNNPVFVCEWSPEAEWKRELINELGRRFDLDTLLETGTSGGGTVESARQQFRMVYSIELSPEYFSACQHKFRNAANVKLFHGSSSRILADVIHQTGQSRLLFWLDAHVTGRPGDPSGNDGDQNNAELQIIADLSPDSLVLIDDVKPLEDGTFNGPDAPLKIPAGWNTKFLAGVLILYRGENYLIPEKF